MDYFKHSTQDISFTLVVDDYGIKYVSTEGVHHIIKVIQEKNIFKVDFNAKQHIAIYLK